MANGIAKLEVIGPCLHIKIFRVKSHGKQSGKKRMGVHSEYSREERHSG